MSEVLTVPEGWETKTLGDLCEILDNQRIPLNDEERQKRVGHIPYYGANKIVDYIDDYLFDEDLILVAEDGGNFDLYENRPIAFKITGKSWVNNHAHVLRIKNYVDFDYVFYSLEHKNIIHYIRGGTRSKLNQSDLIDIQFFLPKLKQEQQKIAKILSTLDSAIEASQKLIAKEKNIKKGLMHDLLTNGIDENGTIRSLKTHKYKESELGLIPVEWEMSCLGKISRTFAGGTPNRDEELYYGGDIPWVKSGEVNQTRINKTEEFITNEGLINSSAKLIKKNTILIAMYGATAGQVAILDIDVTSNQAVLAVPLMKEDMNYILYNINFHMPKLLFQAQGSGQPNLSKQLVDNLNILLAPLHEQQKIATILTAQDKKIETEEKNLEKLKELKKGLMDDLLSGKVRVKV